MEIFEVIAQLPSQPFMINRYPGKWSYEENVLNDLDFQAILPTYFEDIIKGWDHCKTKFYMYPFQTCDYLAKKFNLPRVYVMRMVRLYLLEADLFPTTICLDEKTTDGAFINILEQVEITTEFRVGQVKRSKPNRPPFEAIINVWNSHVNPYFSYDDQAGLINRLATYFGLTIEEFKRTVFNGMLKVPDEEFQAICEHIAYTLNLTKACIIDGILQLAFVSNAMPVPIKHFWNRDFSDVTTYGRRFFWPLVRLYFRRKHQNLDTAGISTMQFSEQDWLEPVYVDLRPRTEPENSAEAQVTKEQVMKSNQF